MRTEIFGPLGYSYVYRTVLTFPSMLVVFSVETFFFFRRRRMCSLGPVRGIIIAPVIRWGGGGPLVRALKIGRDQSHDSFLSACYTACVGDGGEVLGR